MFLQEGPAETLGFMILGLSVIIGTMALFLASLLVRFRSLREDLRVLEHLEAEVGAGVPENPG